MSEGVFPYTSIFYIKWKCFLRVRIPIFWKEWVYMTGNIWQNMAYTGIYWYILEGFSLIFTKTGNN